MESEDLDTSDSDKEQEYIPSQELIKKLQSIDDRMKAYPSYELHLEKVNVLKEMKDAPHLLQAFEDFSKAFPLTSELWLNWIHVAIEQEQSEDDVLSLFSAAVKDYLSVPVWVEYINYAALCLNDELKDENWVRSIYEEALLLPALHVCEGIKIWKAAIGFEKRLYSFCKDEGNPDQKSKVKLLLDRVLELYHRMFSVPLMGIMEEFEEFKEWLIEDDITVENMDDITENFKSSENKLLSIIPHEKKLERCSETDIFKYEVFPKYINYVQTTLGVSTAQITCLYERMIEMFPIETSVWITFLEFLKSTDSSKVLSAAERSVRNCPYSAKLRVEHLKAMEESSDVEIVRESYNSAIEIPFENPSEYLLVWKNYIDFLGRLHTRGTDSIAEMEELFRNTSEVVNKYFYNHKSNPRAQLLMDWAEIKASVFKDIESARDIWLTKILVKHDKSSGELWCKYLDFEKKYETHEKMREAYSNAMTHVSKGAELISEKWLEFEKENGSSEQLNEAIKRCEVRLQNLKVEEQNSSEKSDKHQNKFQPRAINIKPSQGRPPKRKLNSNKEEDRNTESGSGERVSGKWQEIKQPKQKVPPKELNNTDTYMPSTVDEHRTVFLSNLDFSVTEEDIKSVFEVSVGSIETVKLKTDFKGRSKGFGYIVFQSPDSVEPALKMDHTIIKARPVFVSKYNADKGSRKHYFAYSSNQEKNKLFVRGLNFDTTRETLMNLFSQYGTVKDVRLVTFKNGRPKGLAYIEFESEEMATKALQATDGTELDSRKISVAISQPSLSSDRKSDEPKEKVIRKSTTMLMMPSSVKIPPKKPKLDMDISAVNNTVRSNGAAVSEEDPEKSSKSGLSNADFRNMLLKQT